MTRLKIFAMLAKERAYQDKMFGTEFDKLNGIGHWIIYIEQYLDNAKKKFFGSRVPGGANISYDSLMETDAPAEQATYLHTLHKKEILEQIKKVAALCVACLEHLGEDEKDIKAVWEQDESEEKTSEKVVKRTGQYPTESEQGIEPDTRELKRGD